MILAQSRKVFKFQGSSLIPAFLLISPRSGLHKPTTNNQELFLSHRYTQPGLRPEPKCEVRRLKCEVRNRFAMQHNENKELEEQSSNYLENYFSCLRLVLQKVS